MHNGSRLFVVAEYRPFQQKTHISGLALHPPTVSDGLAELQAVEELQPPQVLVDLTSYLVMCTLVVLLVSHCVQLFPTPVGKCKQLQLQRSSETFRCCRNLQSSPNSRGSEQPGPRRGGVTRCSLCSAAEEAAGLHGRAAAPGGRRQLRQLRTDLPRVRARQRPPLRLGRRRLQAVHQVKCAHTHTLRQ